MRRVLLLATTTGYQTRMFGDAAARVGVELVYATDRCNHLDDPWGDGAIAIRFHEEWRSANAILKTVERNPVHGIMTVGDRPTITAAYLAQLLGLPGHAPDAAAAARDKRLSREKLRAAGMPGPAFISVPVTTDVSTIVSRVTFPAVVKPTVLSASRGVIRADDPVSLAAAFRRVAQLLESPDVRAMRDPEADLIQIEEFIPGAEYAVEALLEHGVMRLLAIFDKPDPLDGPFFEETIYVTPSRAAAGVQAAIEHAVAAAATALGLHHGPIHAECRVNERGVFVLEVAARPIGGLCARALRFQRGDQAAGFEEVLLRHALGEPAHEWHREAAASAVMMIPIPRSGVYRRVEGVEQAAAVRGIDDVVITAKADQQLLMLPEGHSYLGFIFARAATPAAAEQAVREAHRCLRFTIDPLIAVS